MLKRADKVGGVLAFPRTPIKDKEEGRYHEEKTTEKEVSHGGWTQRKG